MDYYTLFEEYLTEEFNMPKNYASTYLNPDLSFDEQSTTFIVFFIEKMYKTKRPKTEVYFTWETTEEAEILVKANWLIRIQNVSFKVIVYDFFLNSPIGESKEEFNEQIEEILKETEKRERLLKSYFQAMQIVNPSINVK